ncbi:MAG TPA: hypothetical protein VNQ97_09655, partial [Burkholderiaceae bacterium]|nr:hypothetical protein [Burkholderiaceae bacterium]
PDGVRGSIVGHPPAAGKPELPDGKLILLQQETRVNTKYNDRQTSGFYLFLPGLLFSARKRTKKPAFEPCPKAGNTHC